jgi:hypothetical protein
MKNKILKIGSALAGMFLFLPGCLDIYLTTHIFPNGEIEKTIVIKGDSADIFKAPFFFMQDTGWAVKWVPGDNDKLNYVMTKRFKSFRDLNKTMNPEDTLIQVIRVNSDLRRKFRWFFTYFDYKETIFKTDPYKTQNWRDYLTEKELRLLKITDEDARKADPEYNEQEYKEIEKKYNDFITRSAMEYFYRMMDPMFMKEPSLAEIKQELVTRKEKLYRYLVDSSNVEESRDILKEMGKFLSKPEIIMLGEKYPDAFDLFDRKMKFWDNLGANSYKFIIRMPGLLMATNSTQIQGNETRWEFQNNDIYFDDVVLTCESRMINRWAFWVAGLILVLAIGLAVLRVVNFRKS